jgi:hypothetical protein
MPASGPGDAPQGLGLIRQGGPLRDRAFPAGTGYRGPESDNG